MPFGRAARAALALVIATSASPAAAQAMARVVAIYPLGRSEGAAAEDALALLESALRRASNRTDDVVLSEPLLVRPACGSAQAAPLDCLAKLAGNALLLRPVLHKSERSAAMSIEAVDGKTGRAVGPVTVGIDLYIQNPEPIARALLMLFDDARSAARRQAAGMPKPLVVTPPLTPVQQAAPPKAAEAAKQPASADLHASPPPSKAAPAEAVVSTSSTEPRRSWVRSSAPYVAGTGLALLAGAAVISMKNQSLSNELDRKAQDGTLTPADAASYKKVDQYNTLTIALAASGGALTLTGAVMFTAVPTQGGAGVAMAGRF